MKKSKKQESKPEEKKDRLTPEQCKLAGDFYEEAALEVQRLYEMGATVSEAVKRCLSRANIIRAGRHQ